MKKIIMITAFVLLITTIGLADTIIVDWNGGGDYLTIQAGINAASAGDTVKVKYGTYTEIITINKNITLMKYSTQYPTITSSGNSTIYITNYYGADVNGFNIENTAQNGYGIYKLSGTSIIYDCSISGMDIGIKAVNNDENHVEISHCQIYDNDTGILITSDIEENESTSIISNCNIYQNSIGIKHYPYSPYDLIIEYSNINDNTSKGISIDGGHEITIRNCVINDNIDGNSGYGIYDIAGYCDIINCTIYGNYKGVSFAYGQDQNVINSIIWGNADTNIIGSPTVTYSCIEDGYAGTGNIDDDPQFEDASNGDFHLRWDNDVLSPCIDTGDHNTEWDGDGTPPDMGRLKAAKHWYDNWALPDINTDRGWKWLCFPVIDTVTNNHDYIGDMAEYMLADILNPYLLDHVEWIPIETISNNIINIEFEDPIWTNTNHIFTSIQGYKFQMIGQDTVYLPISGFLEDSTKTIQLNDEHDNWMGYFIDYSQSVEDAFGTSLENMYYIQTQRWTVTREEPEPESPWIGLSSANRTLNYGDLVIVRCFDDELFAWCDTELERQVETREDAQYYSYIEQADYVPIYVQLDPSDLPDEIAVLVDGECKGAEKITGDLADIRAYMLDNTGGDVTFELYYDNKAPVKEIKDYFVYNSKNMELEQRPIKVDPSVHYYMVTLKEDDTVHFSHEYLLKHYPNPVTSSTEIKFSLPKDEKVSLSVYNIKGQIVRTLINADFENGLHKVQWDGSNDEGKRVANGIYFYILTADSKVLTRKLLFMR